jgi:uncharacterized membrane protein YedE/YeeE
MSGYWPFWLAGPALGALTVGYWIAVRRPLGVSGVLARFSRIREEARYDRGNEVLAADPALLEAAMAAATEEAFGPMEPPPAAAADERRAAGRVCAPTPRLSAHATFLFAVVGGGFLAALARGTLGAPLGDAFVLHVGRGPGALAALAAAGLLVGFGASLTGGCSAGHGLTGCGRLMPGSLLSTATFLAAAAGASLLLAWGSGP